MATYSSDKPDSCRHCYFWKRNKKCCGLGEDNCYYLLEEKKESKSICDGCPYGRDHPCIGWCTIQVMRDVGLHK